MSRALRDLNVELLRQGAQLLGSLDDAMYSRPVPALESGGVGGHVRHCIEFYRAFLLGLDTRRIDYDGRDRESRLEREVEEAMGVLGELAARLDELEDDSGPLTVRQDALEDETVTWSESTWDRELRFLAAHTVHHFAMIAMILRHQGHSVPAEFGVAPSTLRFWKARAS